MNNPSKASDGELKQLFDSFGPNPGMTFGAFRAEIRKLTDPVQMQADLGALLRQRAAGRLTKNRIDSALRRN